MRGVECNELFGGIALKNHAFFGGDIARFEAVVSVCGGAEGIGTTNRIRSVIVRVNVCSL